jgi:hypothetical protein
MSGAPSGRERPVVLGDTVPGRPPRAGQRELLSDQIRGHLVTTTHADAASAAHIVRPTRQPVLGPVPRDDSHASGLLHGAAF